MDAKTENINRALLEIQLGVLRFLQWEPFPDSGTGHEIAHPKFVLKIEPPLTAEEEKEVIDRAKSVEFLGRIRKQK
jgi:hypothetical protein